MLSCLLVPPSRILAIEKDGSISLRKTDQVGEVVKQTGFRRTRDSVSASIQTSSFTLEV